MPTHPRLPGAVLICHRHDRLDSVGLAAWLATSTRLLGIVEISGDRGRWRRAVRREWKRSGPLGFADVMAFRLFSWLSHRSGDARWMEQEIARLQSRYPARTQDVPRMVVDDPNSEASRQFIAGCEPDLIIARCKFILSPDIFTLARHGSFALHPGICPEYRNAHGCFWALANRDLARVGMTLLKIDHGIDTGPVLLQAGCEFDELRESHTRIQYRVVTENLDRIAETLRAAVNGEAAPVNTSGRRPAAWGQPRLTAYRRWKRAAVRDRHRCNGLPAVP
jgi:folate-dependent phosphoribosylglycinamide formyltransferase PurN